MAKLTKAQAKGHAEPKKLLQKGRLSVDERKFVLDHWHEGANHVNGAAGGFFTSFHRVRLPISPTRMWLA